MKKQLLLFVVAIMISATGFSQIMLSWEFGPTSLSPSVTFNGSPDDLEIVGHINVQNVGTETASIKVAREQMFMVDGSKSQLCWGVCYSFDTDTSAMSIDLAPGEISGEFSCHYWPETTIGISTVKYTFYDVNNPSNSSTVIVMFNSLFELSSTDGDSVSEHTRILNGDVDTPIHGMIKVHNHSQGPLSLITFKQPVNLIENSTNWFWFGGNEYPFGVDTSALVTIDAGTTDESFEMWYDADGNEGISQIVYAFLDPVNAGNYALYWVHFNAEVTGLSEAILANTTFSAAYPNPASNFVSFDYDIPSEVKQAELVITNLLGAVVYEGSLNNFTGTERINVSQFTEGIYFASLKLDNEIALSQKILVQ